MKTIEEQKNSESLRISNYTFIFTKEISYRREQDRGGNLIPYMIDCKSRAEAKEQAKQASNNHKAPIKHTAHEPDQLPHFHPAGPDGEIKKNGQHFTYPKSK
ncbi:unnamed protein product [Rotaria socialis]